MVRSRLLFVIAAAIASACGGGDPAPADPVDAAAPPPAASACADGFSDKERGYCVEIVADTCAPGTRPRIGDAACVPVGWTGACPAGTAQDPSGWGCIDIPAPAAACAGATRMSVTSPSCVPVGDCNAPFPPAGAILVDDDYGAADLDATHFKTIKEALIAAPKGATVAINAGTYVEGLTIEKPVTVVGRCAAQVHVTSPGGDVSGVLTGQAPTIAVRGITFTGFSGGLLIYNGADATIEDVVIEGSLRVGIEVDQSKATVRRAKLVDPVEDPAKGRAWGISAGGPAEVLAEDVTITGGTDGLFVATEGTHVTLRSSIVSGQKPPSAGLSNRSRGASAVDGGLLTIERSIFRDIVADAALVGDAGSVEASETVIHGVRVDGNAARGHGISVTAAGHIKMRASAIVDAESIGVFGKDLGSSLELLDTVVRGPAKSGTVPTATFLVSSERSGIGLEITTGAKATVENSAIVDSWAYGAYADTTAAMTKTRSTLTMKTSLIENTRPVARTTAPAFSLGLGLVSAGSTVTLDDVGVTHSILGGVSAGRNGTVKGSRVLVRDVVAGKPSTSGGGLQAGTGGVIELDGSAVTRCSSIGVVSYHGAESVVTLRRSTVHGAGVAGNEYGHGIMVMSGAQVALHGTAVFDNAVIGLAASGGRAIVEGCAIASNAIGLQAQDGSFVVESADDQALGEGEVRVTPDSRFLENSVKVGASVLPLPAPLLP